MHLPRTWNRRIFIKELTLTEIANINGGLPVHAYWFIGVSLYNAHKWYQGSGYIDHDMGIPISA